MAQQLQCHYVRGVGYLNPQSARLSDAGAIEWLLQLLEDHEDLGDYALEVQYINQKIEMKSQLRRRKGHDGERKSKNRDEQNRRREATGNAAISLIFTSFSLSHSTPRPCS